MKKIYMKPDGKVVALRVNENISTSGKPVGEVPFGVKYNVAADGTNYIYTSTTPSVSTNDESFNAFYDLIISYLYQLDPNCRFDPKNTAE